MAAVIILTLGAAVAYAQTQKPEPQTPGTQTPVTSGKDSPAISDAKFVEQAAVNGQAEVELGRTAVQKTRHPEVKSFAEELVRDHEKANAELMKLAQERGFAPQGSKGNVPLNKEGSAEGTGERSLAALSGDAFDRQYIQDQEKSHVEAIKLFQAEATDSRDDQLRKFATAQLPILNHHLDQARSIGKSLSEAAASTGAPKTVGR